MIYDNKVQYTEEPEPKLLEFIEPAFFGKEDNLPSVS